MDFQASSTDNLRQRWKRALIGRVDYWFAYTDMTVDILRRNGYPENRITNLNNSIDTTEFRRECDSVDADRIAEFLSAQKIRPGEPIGVYCGSLYAEKRLDLLVPDAADIVRRRLPNFHAVIVGAGPSCRSSRRRPAHGRGFISSASGAALTRRRSTRRPR